MKKIVKTRDKAICCDLCSKLIHIKCKNLNDLDYEYLKNKDKTWCCNTLSEKKKMIMITWLTVNIKTKVILPVLM